MFDLSSLKAGLEAGPKEQVYDVLIIGGGPAGATAALYAARADLKTVVLDKSMAAGALAITSKIANYPGVPKVVTGAELLQTMRDQAASFGAEFITAQVLSVSLAADPKEVQTSIGPFKARVVIIATGKMGRKGKISGEEEFLGRGVSYCATCDAAFFRDGVVAVVGSSREAVEESRLVARFARKVYLVAPGERFHADRGLLAELEADPKVELRRNQGLREVIGSDRVTAIKLSGPHGDERLAVDGVFIYLPGNLPITDFLEGAVEVTEQQCIRVDRERATNIPGVYAAGDVVCSYIQQAVVAAADGAIAAMAAEKYLRGRARVRSDWA
ncbi:MAG: NAD(P)/FAD-dependent oxidoreductase [Sphingomonadaceae bacterium]